MQEDFYDKWIFRCLVLFALATNISTGVVTTMLVVSLLLIVVQSVHQQQCPRIDRGLGKALLIYVVLWCIPTVCSAEPARSFGTVWAVTYRIFPLFLAMCYIRKISQLKSVILAVAVSVLVNDIWALGQMVVAWQTKGIVLRPYGLVHSATFLGSHLLMAIPVLAFFSWKEYFSRYERRLLSGSLVLSILLLVLTQTRGAWLAFVTVLLLCFICDAWYRRHIIRLAMVIILFFGTMVAASPTLQTRLLTFSDLHGQSNQERIYMWTAAIQIWQDHPFVGVGPDEFAIYYNTQYIPDAAVERPSNPDNPRSGHGHPHNNVLKNLSEGGVVGIAAFLFWNGYVFYRLWRKYCEERQQMVVSYALMGLLVFAGLHLEGLTDTNLNQVSIMNECWLLIGIALTAGKIEKQNELR